MEKTEQTDANTDDQQADTDTQDSASEVTEEEIVGLDNYFEKSLRNKDDD